MPYAVANFGPELPGELDRLDAILEAMERRADDLSPIAEHGLRDLLDQNRGINMERAHPDSVIRFLPPNVWVIGSRSASYFRLLNEGMIRIMDAVTDWILFGLRPLA